MSGDATPQLVACFYLVEQLLSLLVPFDKIVRERKQIFKNWASYAAFKKRWVDKEVKQCKGLADAGLTFERQNCPQKFSCWDYGKTGALNRQLTTWPLQLWLCELLHDLGGPELGAEASCQDALTAIHSAHPKWSTVVWGDLMMVMFLVEHHWPLSELKEKGRDELRGLYFAALKELHELVVARHGKVQHWRSYVALPGLGDLENEVIFTPELRSAVVERLDFRHDDDEEEEGPPTEVLLLGNMQRRKRRRL